MRVGGNVVKVPGAVAAQTPEALLSGAVAQRAEALQLAAKAVQAWNNGVQLSAANAGGAFGVGEQWAGSEQMDAARRQWATAGNKLELAARACETAAGQLAGTAVPTAREAYLGAAQNYADSATVAGDAGQAAKQARLAGLAEAARAKAAALGR